MSPIRWTQRPIFATRLVLLWLIWWPLLGTWMPTPPCMASRPSPSGGEAWRDPGWTGRICRVPWLPVWWQWITWPPCLITLLWLSACGAAWASRLRRHRHSGPATGNSMFRSSTSRTFYRGSGRCGTASWRLDSRERLRRPGGRRLPSRHAGTIVFVSPVKWRTGAGRQPSSFRPASS